MIRHLSKASYLWGMKHVNPLKAILWLFLFLGSTFATGQSTCPNADFEQGNFSNWTGYRGGCCPIVANNPGIVNGRHTIMTGNGVDPFSNGTIPVVAPGGTFSARLGNSNVGAQAERLTYSFLVDPSSALFIYRYAVVFEDPNHTPADQPRFQIRVFDQSGISIPCGTYEVLSSAGIPGFETYTTPAGSVIHYKNWTSVGIDLTAYVGQVITIDFAVGDCAQGGHFGYAYLDCYCSPLAISSDLCLNDQVATLSAPSGFFSYLWSTGDVTSTISVPNPSIGTDYTCTITSFTGCVVVLTMTLQPTIIVPDIMQSSPCQSTTLFADATTVVYGSPITQWHWQFGDGETSDEQNPDHYYQQPGTYLTTLTVTNSMGCTDSVTQSLVILPYPIADFSYTPECPGSSIAFIDQSVPTSSPIVAWEWDLGDQMMNDQQNFLHAYVDNIPHVVQLIITDSAACRDTIAYTVNYLPSAVALFEHAASSCLDGGIQFTNTTVGAQVTSLTWDFGDGTSATGQQAPYHVYGQSGQYTVTLIVTDVSDCTDTVSVLVGVQSTIQPGFNFGVSCSNDTTQFSDASSTNFGTIVQWDWDFGDGSPMASGPQTNHVYQVDGQYPVELTITLDNGCTNSIIDTVDVLLSPTSDFIFDPACQGQPFNFTTQSTNGSSNITQYAWDMGDGTPTLTTSSAQHAYSVDSSYVVIHTVIDSNGCSSSIQRTVSTLPSPVANYFIPQGCVSSIISFTNLSSIAQGSIVSATWDFNDGSEFGTNYDETHVFTEADTYFVRLTVMSEKGCVSTVVNEVVISDNPVSDFTSTLACPNGTINIVDQSVAQNGSIIMHQWSVDEGETWNTGTNVLNVSFPDAGWHEIGLVTTNSAGCTDTTYTDVLVLDTPTASFVSYPVCEGAVTDIVNTSTFMTGIPTSYSWNLHNGYTSNSEDVSYTFPYGTHPVTLTVEYPGIDACIDSLNADVIVWPNPIPDISPVPELCESSTTFIYDASTIIEGNIDQWTWEFQNGRISYVQNPVIPYVDAGVYGVHLTVTSDNGCIADSTFLDAVTVLPSPEAHFTSAPNNVTIFNNVVRFFNTSSFADQYQWSFGDGTGSTEFEPIHGFAESGEYEIMLVAYNSIGCTDTMRAILSVHDTYALYIPNTFTPNGDGLNEVFMAKGFNIKDFELLIFNLWGELIYTTHDINSGWNGVYEGVPSQIDVYVYRVLFTDIFNHHHELFGTVNLVR